MAGVQKTRLNNLNINVRNALIVGIIIAKSSPRVVGSKKKSGDARAVMTFTLRDSNVDTINADVWGSEYFVITFYERFLVGDVVEISSPKICVKGGDHETYRPQVSSPFYLSLSEGSSDVTIHSGEEFTMFLPLLHIPSKLAAGYYGIAEVLKLSEQNNNGVYVDLLVVVKSVGKPKTIKTKLDRKIRYMKIVRKEKLPPVRNLCPSRRTGKKLTASLGMDMTVRTVEIMDNTTPASLNFDIFDIDTIQRAEEWRPLESVLFIADCRVRNSGRGVGVVASGRTVITHQPHTPHAEALRLYMRAQAETRGGEAAAWAAWSGERAGAASVAQVKDRLANAANTPFCAALHAILTHINIDPLVNNNDPNNNIEDIRVRFADHTGEVSAKLPISVLEDTLGYSTAQLKAMSADERSSILWNFLLEQCHCKLAGSAAKLMVLTLRRASPADPIPLY